MVDSADQIEARTRRLLSGGEIAVEALTAALPESEPGSRAGVLERILGLTSELQSVNFLPRGERVARTVARISLQQRGRTVGFGTGFLVGPRLLMTNNHVLPDPATAAAGFAEFDCEVDRDGASKPFVPFDLDPGALFLTDAAGQSITSGGVSRAVGYPVAMRLHITLDDELVRDLDHIVGARERSSFIARAVRRAIDEFERTEALEAALGSIPDSGHDWDADPAAWVRAQRTDREQLAG